MGLLEGKVAVVTGGGGGIGRAHCLLFAREGAKVVVNDLGCARDGTGRGDAAAEVVADVEAQGGQAVASLDDVGTSEGARRLVQTAIDAFGGLDVLVNNAGILRDRTLLKMTEDEWDDVIRVHLRGTFNCTQAAARRMVEQGRGGRIINTSSSSGLLGHFGQSNYGAAKAGIHALTRIAAWELAKHRITVNAISPAALTRMLEAVPGVRDTVTEATFGPQFIAPLVAYLASDAAAAITGQTFGVEGNHLFVYRMMTSHGSTKRGSAEPWTVEEIGAKIDLIMSW
jgi:NAD(P)-dependent dehydrogenase (short-subunit alcohol dehydrogenase family)